ncbi:phage/plasmid primase, P4 family [Leisingera sp. F5]|uniref:DNA primase family protein n=1 Tax=Leisingera sp. F5 TaxID=1813816 RepID=UPI000A79A7DF|nr:DNA primase family protein [Leisingera sp. F5]
MQGQPETIRDAFRAAEPVVGSSPAVDDPGELPPDEVPPVAAYQAEVLGVQGAEFPRNDYGNGQRLVLYYGENFLFVPRLGWFRWDGRRWASDEDEILVRRDAQGIAARIMHEIPFLAPEFDANGNNKAAARHATHANSSGNTGKITNMLAEAKTAKGVAVTVEDLNKDPMMLCVENGVLHFTKRKDEHSAAWDDAVEVPQVDLLPHDRRHRITKMVKAKYDPQAKCPAWGAFLLRVLPDDEVRGFFKRWCGYNLTGLTTEQKLAFFFGQGRNGKSTAVDTLARIMGDYSTTLPIESLTGTDQGKGGEATPDLVRLPGARFVRSSEPEQGQKMKEARIKALTGGEPIPIRRLHQEAVDLFPEFKLNISGNYQPEVRGADDGIWRRILLVPWSVQIPAEEVDPLLPQKLWAERDGILRWMVEGCLEWMAGGLRVPAVIDEATKEYRSESDPMRTFLQEYCRITGSPENFETARDLRDAFNAWLLDSGTSAWTPRHTSNSLKRRANNVKGDGGEVFYPVKRSTTGYLGIQLLPKALELRANYRDQLERMK